MRILGICMLIAGIAACGPAGSAPAEPAKTTAAESQQISEMVEETVEEALKGDFGSDEVSEASCAMFENGVIPDLFGINAALITHGRSIPVKRIGHVVCYATWDKPDKAELETAFQEKIQEWGRGMAAGKKEPMPKPARLESRVSITLIATQFDSADAAVANLESSVATLEKGVTTNVKGKDYTVQSDFGEWLDGVGDKAIFNDNGELMVAYNGKRISVVVEVSDDPAVNRNDAIELAKRIMQSH